MANIDIDVGGRRYNVACRDGEEEHLRGLAATVDHHAAQASTALGALTETRHLLFAALLLADHLKEVRAGMGLAEPAHLPPDPAVADALEKLAGRMESFAESLEKDDPSA